MIPEVLAKALERRFCTYAPEVLTHEVPSGSYEFEILPTKHAYLIFALSRGSLDPAGYSESFIMKHRGQFAPDWVVTPWVQSVVGTVEPVWQLATKPQPFRYMLTNNTGATQTANLTLYGVQFETPEEWDEYRAMVEEQKSVEKNTRELVDHMKELKELLRGRPVSPVTPAVPATPAVPPVPKGCTRVVIR